MNLLRLNRFSCDNKGLRHLLVSSTRNGAIKLCSKNYINSPFKAESGLLDTKCTRGSDGTTAGFTAATWTCRYSVTVALLHPIPSQLSELPSRDTNPAAAAITINVLSIEAIRLKLHTDTVDLRQFYVRLFIWASSSIRRRGNSWFCLQLCTKHDLRARTN